MEDNTWQLYDDGKTLGGLGSENGTIRADEEYPLGARITLEEDGYQSWSITCGIYGSMVHTACASSEVEAREKYETMKATIGQFLDYIESDAVSEEEVSVLSPSGVSDSQICIVDSIIKKTPQDPAFKRGEDIKPYLPQTRSLS